MLITHRNLASHIKRNTMNDCCFSDKNALGIYEVVQASTPWMVAILLTCDWSAIRTFLLLSFRAALERSWYSYCGLFSLLCQDLSRTDILAGPSYCIVRKGLFPSLVICDIEFITSFCDMSKNSFKASFEPIQILIRSSLFFFSRL